VAWGTGVAAATSALLKGARRGDKDGGRSDGVHVEEGKGGWYGTLMSWRGGGGRQLATSVEASFGWAV
jgi:hypothetical protein